MAMKTTIIGRCDCVRYKESRLAVRKTIRGVPGVLNVSVHLDRSEVTAFLATRQKATLDNILDAVRKAGYEANMKSFEPVRHNP